MGEAAEECESCLVDQMLATHSHDPRAAIYALLVEIAELHERLLEADACISKGYSRGWSAIEATDQIDR